MSSSAAASFGFEVIAPNRPILCSSNKSIVVLKSNSKRLDYMVDIEKTEELTGLDLSGWKNIC